MPRRALLLTAAVLPLAAAALAGPINETKGLAIHGTDPVAYFTRGRAVAGSPKIKARHQGAEYRFATAAHRDSFKADPTRYLPAYGGFCAYGTAQGYKATIDPEAFTIAGGRLYLNYNLEVRDLWSRDIPGFISKADRNWPEVAKTTTVHR